MELKGSCVMPGIVEGETIVSTEPISFLGDVDPYTGEIVAQDHPLKGQNVKGKVLVFPCGKGSTVGSYVINQLQKSGNAPKAIINQEAEAIVAVGAIIAGIPMVNSIDISKITHGQNVRLNCKDGIVIVEDTK